MNTIDTSFFDTSRGFTELPDDITREAVRSYVLTQTDYNNHKLCLSKLCALYPNIPISDFSSESLYDTCEKWGKRGSRKLFVSFLIFACKNKYLIDSRLQRLVAFSSCVSTITQNIDYIFYIVNDDHFDNFYRSNLYSHIAQPYAFTIYRYCLDENIVIDENTRTAINEFIADVKFSSERTISATYDILRGINSVCDKLFENQSYLTDKSVKSLFYELSKKTTTLNPHTPLILFGIVNALYEKDLLVDPALICLATINANYKGNITIFRALEILESEHPEYWTSGIFSNNGHVFTRYINHPSLEVRKLICTFISSHYKGSLGGIPEFCEQFFDSLGDYIVNTPKDFCFLTFKSQVEYFYNTETSNELKHTAIGVLVSFYLYLCKEVNDNIFEKDGVPTSILHRQYIAKEIGSGFTIIKYNQLEEVPNSDKWLLCYKKYERDSIINVKLVDFTRIESTTYRLWIKHYAWKADVAIYTKFHPIPRLTAAFNYIYELKVGKQFSIFTQRGNESKITVNDIIAYKNVVLAKYNNNRTRSGYIYGVRSVLRHVADNHLGIIDSGIYYTLTHTLDQTYDNTQPIPNEQLGQIAKLLKSKAESDSLADIYSSIFFIALETEFRGSQIVNLNKSCLQQASKKGEYVIVSETKTSAGELVEQPISSYVEKEIRHVIAITNIFREQCTDIRLHNKLFISPAHKLGTFKKVTESQFNTYLKKCCLELGLPQYTISNLRDTHMTKAEEYRIRNQLSELEQSILTGHSTTAVDDIHYVKLNIRDMLEALHGVIIGDVKLDGKVYTSLDDSVANSTNEVSNGCGWCNNESCNIMVNLDCTMCKDFVTTISRLPYFEEQMQILDKKIETATFPHDKEDFVNIKRLMLRYIEEILKKKEEYTNANK